MLFKIEKRHINAQQRVQQKIEKVGGVGGPA